ncbi:MAG: hypothetical protein J5I81_03085 [Nitrococcus mobilis]|nr:hypothetical protein [Nitrococcus mobilis]
MSGTGHDKAERLAAQLAEELDRLEAVKPFAKLNYQGHICDLTLRLLKEPQGVQWLYEQAARFDRAGVFYGGDWAHPALLQPALVSASVRGPALSVAIESLSELRLLAIATGEAVNDEITPDGARAFLEDALARNLDLLFPQSSEVARAERTPLLEGVHRLFRFIADRLGTQGILESTVNEATRILRQRPILVHHVREMIDAAVQALAGPGSGAVYEQARRLTNAVHGPSALSRSAASLEHYREALVELDAGALAAEAQTFAHSMHETGLVSPQHAVLLEHILAKNGDEGIARVLGLDSVGRDSLDAYSELVRRLIGRITHPLLAQSIYGLACMLNRGVLFFPPLAPGLWRLTRLQIKAEVAAILQRLVDDSPTPSANALLLAGTVSVLGQPLGVGQGDNPTCQSARAISLWSQCDPGFLLELITWAARDNEVDMHFEGQLLRSTELQTGGVAELHTELDPVSLVLVPHLDRIYWEMGRRIAGRGEDGHKWINPEFHGWWVQRGFATVIQYSSGDVIDFEGFMRLFYISYHPAYNGARQLIYAQPAGIAATDKNAQFIGWHAVSIQRVTVDQDGEVRVYFYNPNNDGGQDWGQGIVTSTAGHGEFPGESSLPFKQFAARIYVFHYNTRELGDPAAVPAAILSEIAALARASWARGVGWHELVSSR